MNDSPLAVLGLSPDGMTVKAIKAAYAGLLKVHRPDQDPDGFKRLRQAYEAALLACETGASLETKGPNADVMPVDAKARPKDLTPGAQAAFDALCTAIGSRARQRVREAWAKLDAEAVYLSLSERLHLAMNAFNQAPIALLSDVCTDERLLAHVRDGELQLAHAALKGWTEQRDSRRIRDFVTSLNRARSMHSLPDCALVMVWTSVAIAAWEPETANRLAQKAYPALPTQDRAELMQRAELEISLSRLVMVLPETEKLFWLACLRGHPPSASWGDVDGRKMLTNRLQLCGPNWPGFNVLSQSLPEDQWQRLVAALNGLLR